MGALLNFFGSKWCLVGAFFAFSLYNFTLNRGFGYFLPHVKHNFWGILAISTLLIHTIYLRKPNPAGHLEGIWGIYECHLATF